MFVIGTAGHIDHGKSLLVRALTGIDPDRLREEKERGMTIDLGFAWLKLPSGREVGVVDVPGHERFIKNMLAGVGGIDLALLVVAADEGTMPQTREHLAILDLLDISQGIVVITKKDLVDEEMLSLVRMEVEELIAPTSLRRAEILAVSAVTGEGLPELISAVDRLLAAAEPRKDIDRPRLAIDRAFTMSGSGTVVTGTLVDGKLSVGQEMEIVPPGLKARLRGLQTHKAKLETASPGSRVAANLVGLSISELERGYVLTKPGWLLPTARMDVQLRMLPDISHPLRHGATVNFFSGAAEVEAKVHLLEKDRLGPGDAAWAQLALDRPVAVVKGDHFIIRSPAETLGGGTIVNAHAPRHRRFRQSVVQGLEARGEGGSGEALAAVETGQPVDLKRLALQCNLSADETRKIVGALVEQGKVVTLGEGDGRLLFTTAGWQSLAGRAKAAVEDYHRKYPARHGMPKVELVSKLGLPPQSPAMRKLFEDGVLSEEGAAVRLPSYQVQLSHDQQALVTAFLSDMELNPCSPTSEVVLEPDLLTLLVEQGKVVKLGDGVVFPSSAYREMVDKIVAYARERGKVTLAEVRDLLGTSRKYAKALLENMDERKLTRRVGDERVLR